MQRAAARRRMMEDVPKADVIVTNPTHYSVALRYDENKMSAPKVVAKGAGLIALRIRKLAQNTACRSRKPLRWRVPFTAMRISDNRSRTTLRRRGGSAGPVWQLKRWRLAGGQRPVKPENLPVPAALDFMNEKDSDG